MGYCPDYTGDDFAKAMKVQREAKAHEAEVELHNGISLETVAKKFGYKTAQGVLSAISNMGVMPPLSTFEKECVMAHLNSRITGAKTRRKFAKYIGLVSQTIDGWQRGISAPAPCLLTNIAHGLGMKRDELFEMPKKKEGEIVGKYANQDVDAAAQRIQGGARMIDVAMDMGYKNNRALSFALNSRFGSVRLTPQGAEIIQRGIPGKTNDAKYAIIAEQFGVHKLTVLRYFAQRKPMPRCLMDAIIAKYDIMDEITTEGEEAVGGLGNQEAMEGSVDAKSQITFENTEVVIKARAKGIHAGYVYENGYIQVEAIDVKGQRRVGIFTPKAMFELGAEMMEVAAHFDGMGK